MSKTKFLISKLKNIVRETVVSNFRDIKKYCF